MEWAIYRYVLKTVQKFRIYITQYTVEKRQVQGCIVASATDANAANSLVSYRVVVKGSDERDARFPGVVHIREVSC